VRLQFLFEAVVLTLIGGTIGILIGAGVSTAVRALALLFRPTLSYWWVSIGFAMSVGVGLFFGYYPANLAANLDPITCLRYE
jgi:putative ABC transport system permease protein